jgi:hypothetical protein
MTDKELLEFNKKCALFLGWKETTDDFKIKWSGCQTKERLDKVNPLFLPILEKDGEVLFSDFSTSDFTEDWNFLMLIIDKIETIDREDGNGNFRLVMYNKSCNWNDLPPSTFGDSKKDAVIKIINKFLV